MIKLRPYNKLGGANHGWLDTRHHFSFAEYYGPNRMNWGNLRVWNDDAIAPPLRVPPPSAPRHGNHHLRAQRGYHSSR